jgi:hypothetical protein
MVDAKKKGKPLTTVLNATDQCTQTTEMRGAFRNLNRRSQ